MSDRVLLTETFSWAMLLLLIEKVTASSESEVMLTFGGISWRLHPERIVDVPTRKKTLVSFLLAASRAVARRQMQLTLHSFLNVQGHHDVSMNLEIGGVIFPCEIDRAVRNEAPMLHVRTSDEGLTNVELRRIVM